MGKLMFIPFQTENQLKMCLSIAEKFFKMYGDLHEVYIVVSKDWEEKLKSISSQIKIATFSHPNEQLQKEWLARTGRNKSEVLATLCENLQVCSNSQRINMVNIVAKLYETFLCHIVKMYPFVTRIIQEIKPDFIIQNLPVSTPLGIDQNIPYAMLLSCCPTFFGGEDLPPPMSDLETEPTIENKKKWSEFFNQAHLLNHCYLKVKYNNWLKANHCVNLDERMFYLVESPYFNIQLYPQPLDFNVELPGKWIKLQSAVFNVPPPLEIPNKLRNLEGKLIYVNLGCNRLVYSAIFDQLLTILPEIRHRFILADDLDKNKIAENVYGSSDIDHLKAMQIADLIIYNGGTKTMCDSFHFGVPGLVFPLFGDQIDNSRRLCDKKMGLRILPNELSKESLEEAINKCLDLNLVKKFKEISMRIKEDNGLEAVCKEIVKYLN